MNTAHPNRSKALWASGLIALSMLTVAFGARAQSQGPSTSPNQGQTPPITSREDPGLSAPAQASVHSATALGHEFQSMAIQGAAEPAAKVSIVPKPASPTVWATPLSLGSPVPFGGVRVLRVPTACTPKTNSLDCVQDSTQAGQGASVEGRVRHGVIGEVGTGHATTEGGSGAKREDTCTPKPGELTCTPSAPASTPGKP